MTEKEAAIVMAYTGTVLGKFGVYHQYIEELLERPVYTHELASKSIIDEIKNKSKNDFINLEIK